MLERHSQITVPALTEEKRIQFQDFVGNYQRLALATGCNRKIPQVATRLVPAQSYGWMSLRGATIDTLRLCDIGLNHWCDLLTARIHPTGASGRLFGGGR